MIVLTMNQGTGVEVQIGVNNTMDILTSSCLYLYRTIKKGIDRHSQQGIGCHRWCQRTCRMHHRHRPSQRTLVKHVSA